MLSKREARCEMRVRDIMTTPAITVSPETPFPELIDRLLSHGVSGMPVVDASGVMVGIVTEGDLVPKEAYGGHKRRLIEVLADVVAGGETRWVIKARGRTAAQVMTRDVTTVGPDVQLRAAARRLVEAGVKRMPVVDETGHVLGVVSRRDMLQVLHRSDDEIRDELEAALGDPRRAPEHLDVDVTVEDGVVTLAGTALFPQDIGVLTSMTWRVPGVVDVSNHVQSREPDPKPY
jgi:CBS-domain-containing membrane protein